MHIRIAEHNIPYNIIKQLFMLISPVNKQKLTKKVKKLPDLSVYCVQKQLQIPVTLLTCDNSTSAKITSESKIFLIHIVENHVGQRY